MSITAKETVDTLNKLTEKIQSATDHERTTICMTIDAILDKLERWLETSQEAKDKHPFSNSASMYITEMKGPLYSLAGLNSYYQDQTQCIVWLKSGLKKLSSKSCLGL